MINKLKKILKKPDLLSLVGNMMYAALGFASFLILTRSFPKEIFGEWVLFVTTSNFIEMFRFGITRTAIVRFLSGGSEEEKEKLIGANWLIGIVITLIIIFLVGISNLLFRESIQASGFNLFFIWYPIYAILNLPFNNALTVLQAKLQFGKILQLRTINILLFDLFLMANLLYLKVDINSVIIVFLVITSLTSFISLVKKWDGAHLMFKSDKAMVKKILDFGKYTTGTLIGSNLLKSADTFIITLSPILGTAGVALYSVPLKLTEVMEIPLRSFAATAFPKMSKASIENDLKKVKALFYKYAGALTLLFIPFAIFNFIFAEFFVSILGGKEYLETANIYRIFCLYGLILPLDRFTGVGLDAINRPKQNFYKVIFMVMANIIGDLIAVFVFESIFLVAVITIVMTFVGIFVGYYYFNKEVKLDITRIFKDGNSFLLNFRKNISQ